MKFVFIQIILMKPLGVLVKSNLHDFIWSHEMADFFSCPIISPPAIQPLSYLVCFPEPQLIRLSICRNT